MKKALLLLQSFFLLHFLFYTKAYFLDLTIKVVGALLTLSKEQQLT